MANVPVDPTASYTVAADVIGGIDYQRVKLDIGASGTTSGDVGATNPLPVTGTITASISTQISGTVSVSGAVQVSGAVSISVMPAVSGTVTVNGSVAVVPGVSVVAQVSGTVTISPTTLTVNTAAALPGSTTGSSGMSGVLVWLGASQTVIISTQVSGTLTVNGSVAISGTGLVSVVQASAAPIWVTGTVAAGAGTTVVSVTGQVLVSVSGVTAITTMANSGVAGLVVWLGSAQTINVDLDPYETTDVPNISSTGVVVRQVGMQPTTAQPGAGATGPVVWVANPTSVTVTVTIAGTTTGTVSLLSIAATTTTPPSGVTGLPVWPGTPQYTPVIIRMSASAAQGPDLPIAFTIYTGGALVSTTAWPVPAGKNLRILAMVVYAKTSAVISFANLGVAAVTATASLSVTSTLPVVAMCPYGITAATAAFSAFGLAQDVAAGTTIGLVVIGGTTHSILGGVIHGYLF